MSNRFSPLVVCSGLILLGLVVGLLVGTANGVGVTVFRALFPERRGVVTLGLQPERIGESAVFVLPNPSGRNAHYSYGEMLNAFRGLRRTASLASAR